MVDTSFDNSVKCKIGVGKWKAALHSGNKFFLKAEMQLKSPLQFTYFVESLHRLDALRTGTVVSEESTSFIFRKKDH
jgi:hypothetical protein